MGIFHVSIVLSLTSIGGSGLSLGGSSSLMRLLRLLVLWWLLLWAKKKAKQKFNTGTHIRKKRENTSNSQLPGSRRVQTRPHSHTEPRDWPTDPLAWAHGQESHRAGRIPWDPQGPGMACWKGHIKDGTFTNKLNALEITHPGGCP